jgi:hypothetical protein
MKLPRWIAGTQLLTQLSAANPALDLKTMEHAYAPGIPSELLSRTRF